MKKLLILILSSIYIMCHCYKQSERKSQWAAPIKEKGVPNLFKVNNMLYRSGQPTKEGMKSLKKMGIKTVVNLCPNSSDKDEVSSTGLHIEQVKMNPWNIEDEDIIAVLRILGDKRNAPFLIHCLKGSDRTGIICAMYRIIYEGWSKEDALTSMVNGNFGYHEIWGNIKEYLIEVDIEKIKQEIGVQ